MIRSMTGFGVASAQVDGAHYAVEVRSLNNRYFKAQFRLPEELTGLEAEIEPAVVRRLNRGSVLVAVHFSDTSADAAARINAHALLQYMDQLRVVTGDAAAADVGALLSLPGVVIPASPEALLHRVRPVIMQLLDQACDGVLAMRATEGRTLHRQLHRIREQIAQRLEAVARRAPAVVEQYQQRLRDRINALLAESGMAVRDEDLVREVAVYAERSDIAEEVTRLQGHLAQFAEIIDAEDEDPAGRTLDFLAQEMLREANTIASKCLDAEISRHIVEIKGAIDRIKEQVQNVE
jgi:uncharacterized protein (TIGR00255 family)